jgi:diguanylate cyclase (GGDEF)-like protein
MNPRDVAQKSASTAAQVPASPHTAHSGRRQRIRMRRFVFASVFSIVFVGVLSLFYAQGMVDGDTLAHAALFVLAFIVAFYFIFRTGINLKFSDPSLTGLQFLAAVVTMLYVVYHAPDTRLAFTPFFFVAVMFGMLRRDSRKIAILGFVSVVLFVLLTVLRYANNHDAEILRLDMLQCLVMAVTLPWILFLEGHLQRLHQGLADVRMKLEDIEEKAARDELTGVYNRRALLAAMHDSKLRSDVTGEPFSICMIDLDLFKRYNDEFDHLTGDQVLRTFARAVMDGLRTTDFFGRYGGEEFVQILPRTPLAGAIAEAERLRSRLGKLELPVTSSIGRLTVSIGVAEYVPKESIEQTFARADSALYKAKHLGRDRVEASDGSAPAHKAYRLSL